jgi:hypothetical protein
MLVRNTPPVIERPRTISGRYAFSHHVIVGSFQYCLRAYGFIVGVVESGAQRPDDDRGHQQVGEREREHELPREAQQLIVAKARQRPANEDLEARRRASP